MKRLLEFVEFVNESDLERKYRDLKDGNPRYPKVPVENVFFHDNFHRDNISFPERREADERIDQGTFEDLPVEEVDVEKIVPTQKFLTIDNLRSARDGENTGAYLLKHKDLYYILDGHHRIANKILSGETNIKGYVYKYSSRLYGSPGNLHYM